MNDEFYIGWEDQAAPGIKRFVRRIVLLLLAAWPRRRVGAGGDATHDWRERF